VRRGKPRRLVLATIGREVSPLNGDFPAFAPGRGPRRLRGHSEVATSLHNKAVAQPTRTPTPVSSWQVRPRPDDPRLSVTVGGIDHEGRRVETAVVAERPLTLFLNAREIVTMMTIGDRPDLLAVGYLLNQNMLKPDDEITAVDYEEDIATVVVRTRQQTDFEDKLRKKTQTSGCAQGTVFGDLMEEFDKVELNPDAKVRTSWLYQRTKKINTQPSLYLKAG